MSDQRLFLIDGHALIFKMHYAFASRRMINAKGIDTSILFGFTKYLFELLEREKPSHIAVALDPPGGTFRNKLYEPYKANRPPTPQPVIDALQPIIQIVNALNIPVLMMSGYEADDVIGSVAKRSAKEGVDVYMVTPDKDYGQLVEEHIFQYRPGKNGGDDEILGVNEVCQKYGISDPSQVIEFLTICGDTSDNVPGVKGVGEVGAAKYLAKYYDVKGIYAHLDELKPKQKALFEQAADHIELSHELVTIKTDIDVPVSLSDMAFDKNYSSDIVALLDYYEFRTLKKYVSHIKPSGKQVSIASPIESLFSSATKPEENITESKTDKRDKAIEDTTLPSSYEVEKTDPMDLCKKARAYGKCSIVADPLPKSIFSKIESITVATVNGRKYYSCASSFEDFKEILEDDSIIKVGYGLKLISNALFFSGVNLSGKFMDIELLHYLADPEKSHDENELVSSYLGISLDEDSSKGDSSDSGLLFGFAEDEEDVARDQSMRASALLALSSKIYSELSQSGLDKMYDTMEEPLSKVLAKMERDGVKVDLAPLRSFSSELQREMVQREKTIREMTGEPNLMIGSPKQIGTVLFEKMKLDPNAKKNAKGFWPTDEATLTELSDKSPVIDEILEYRGVKKLLSTYIEPFGTYISEKTGKVHTTFNQALTSTGRLSSSNPNLQNIPIRDERGKEIRKAFVSSFPGGVILSADYSQVELRLMAHLSCDQHLVSAFRSGVDIHSATASKIFNIPVEDVTTDQRRIAKTANFGIMYGISAFGLAQRLKISRSEAKKIINDYFESFPAIKSYINDTLDSARENGYVETIFGRRRYIRDINSNNANIRSFAERNAVNAPIQGTAADIIKLAMIEVDKAIEEAALKSRMVLQIHDELVFDAIPEEVETLKKIVIDKMENVVKLSIPLTVECNYGTNWLEAH